MTEVGDTAEMYRWFGDLASETQNRWLDLVAYDGRKVPDDLVWTLPPGRQPPAPPSYDDQPGQWVTSGGGFRVRPDDATKAVDYIMIDQLWEFLVTRAEMRDWLDGLKPEVQQRWRNVAQDDGDVPRDLIDTLPRHRQPHEVKGWVMERSEAHWGMGSGGVPVGFKLRRAFLEFLLQQ